MTDDYIRAFLYPITGTIASCAFGSRFFIQWIMSERRGKSYVPRIFWYISLLGNIALLVHYAIQVQYPFALVQGINAVISWRNINIMREEKYHSTFLKTLIYLFLVIIILTSIFAAQSLFIFHEWSWIRVPLMPWESSPRTTVSIWWHLFGTIGTLLFTSRFWLQWWQIEKHKVSYLSKSFWWLSLIGAATTITYGIYITDWVIIIGYGSGIISYVRNLMLLGKTKPKSKP